MYELTQITSNISLFLTDAIIFPFNAIDIVLNCSIKLLLKLVNISIMSKSNTARDHAKRSYERIAKALIEQAMLTRHKAMDEGIEHPCLSFYDFFEIGKLFDNLKKI